MSDTMTNEPQPGADPGVSEGSGGQRRLLMIVGGLAALLVLGLGVYFLFLSGGGEEQAYAPIPKGTPAPTATDDEKSDKGGDDNSKNDPVDIQVGHDPFEPLSVEAAKAVPTENPTDSSTPGSDSGTDPVTPPGGTGGTNPQPNPPVSTPTTQPTQPSDNPPTPPSTKKYKVTLKSVRSAKSAVIQVNNKRYVVKVGDLFTDTKTGPFVLRNVTQQPGKDTALVVFGSDAPVELSQKKTVVFEP